MNPQDLGIYYVKNDELMIAIIESKGSSARIEHFGEKSSILMGIKDISSNG
jgi:hypothetical protein